MHLHALTFVLSLLMCLAPLPTAKAHPRGPSAPYVVTVEDGSGRRLPIYHQGGDTYVLGEYGTRYVVRVRNQTARRVEAVITVDGRDVVSGDAGDFVRQRGYVIEPHDSVVVEGFRKSHDAVASFRFTNPSDSYSSRMGTPQNVGVIGVAVFPERPRPRPYRPHRPYSKRHHDHDDRYDTYGSAGSAGSAGHSPGSGHRARRRHGGPAAEAPVDAASSARPAPAAEPKRSQHKSRGAMESYADGGSRHNLGTRYGEHRDSSVHEVAFRRERPAHPERIIQLHYDDADGLRARGIRMWRDDPVVHHRHAPEPFPYNRFAPPPPR